MERADPILSADDFQEWWAAIWTVASAANSRRVTSTPLPTSSSFRAALDRGYSEDDIAAILHGNWLRLLRSAWDREQV